MKQAVKDKSASALSKHYAYFHILLCEFGIYFSTKVEVIMERWFALVLHRVSFGWNVFYKELTSYQACFNSVKDHFLTLEGVQLYFSVCLQNTANSPLVYISQLKPQDYHL